MGQGACGFVFSAEVVNADGDARFVAVKRMAKVFTKISVACRVLQEIAILRQLHHVNLLRLQAVLLPAADAFNEVYLVSELMETDLGSVLKSKQQLSTSQVQFMFFQLATGVSYMHSVGIIHRDIKPRNLLLNSDCSLKICDFGLARLARGNPRMTNYVCTRWYRAPEILCDSTSYDSKVDIFSMGCVLGEIVGRRPLLPGASADHQLDLTIARFGAVSPEDQHRIPEGYFKRMVELFSRMVKPEGDLEKYLVDGCRSGQMIPGTVALIASLCTFNADKRPTASDVVHDEWFGNLRNATSDTNRCEMQLDPSDNALLERSSIRSAIRREAALLKKSFEFGSAKSEDSGATDTAQNTIIIDV